MSIKITNELLNYADFTWYSDTFVETGSAAGDGIQRALDAGFAYVHSIEAERSWFEMCMKRFINNERACLHLGKSTDVLGKLTIPTKKQGIVFFLDAHPSGPLSAGHTEVLEDPNGECSQDNIIKAELEIILSKYRKPIIIIDDQNGIDEYSNRYVEIIQLVHPEYVFEFYDENLGGNHFYKNKLLVARHE